MTSEQHNQSPGAEGNHQEEAAKLGFDLTKQFITLAIGGIAFVVGMTVSNPSAISSLLLWSIIGVFALSVILGLFFLLHGVNILCIQRSYDIYATSLRFLAGAQIILVLLGVGLLVPVLYGLSPKGNEPPTGGEITIENSGGQRLSYPVDATKDYQIEMSNGRVTFSTTNSSAGE